MKNMDIKPGYVLNHSPSSQSFMLASLFKFPGGKTAQLANMMKDCTHTSRVHNACQVFTQTANALG